MPSGLVLLLLAAAPIAAGAQQAPALREPWQSQYSGRDATGDYVIALWQFNAGSETRDSSGHGHDCRLDGATINPAGRFGSALQSYRGWPDDPSTRHAAVVANRPDLSPHGAFTIEMWIKPGPKLKGYPEAFLIDKRYVSNNDYQLILSAADKQGRRRLTATLGFGAFSKTWQSQALAFTVGRWYHIAFVYDGSGTGRFFVNGVLRGQATHPECGSISPGQHPLSIGDRVGSWYHGFPGLIDQVRICKGALEFAPVRVEYVSDRWVFRRMEKHIILPLRVVNLQRRPMNGAKVVVSVCGYGERTFSIPSLKPGSAHAVEYPLDASLRPDDYRLEAAVSVPGEQPYTATVSFPVSIVARPLPKRMPVLMWGIGGTGVEKEAKRLKHIGFTHCLGLAVDYKRIFEAGKPTEPGDRKLIEDDKRALNVALHEGIGICASLSPGAWLRRTTEKYLRVRRDGTPYKGHYRDICGLLPEVQKFCYNVGASVAQAFHNFPAFECALIHSEVRDAAQPCFHQRDRQAFRTFAGLDIPPQVQLKWGVPYKNLKGFPANRVVADDDPIYLYYKWYWKYGDGWNGLNTAVVEGLKSAMPQGFWTFHDPAVRVASVYGSGGKVDVLSQWTYTYPDPIRIATATDELLAMAAGANPPQQVMKMTQIIWYRSQTAPPPKKGEKLPYVARWEREQPDAPFITIAPMHLREAFWTKISRPIKGIMYHGWQSLVPTERVYGYRYTNPQTKEELRRLIHTVVRPLGPTLVQVPGVASDVAYLESFAAEMFAQRGTYGWGHTWLGDAYLIMQWAHLQPEIVFDETILNRGLDHYRVLVMMDCDVLTRGVVEKVKQFQTRGGIVVGDERLCPAIKPDIVIHSYERTKNAKKDKQELQKRAAQLCAKLKGRYRRYVDCSNPDVVVYRRRYKTTDYVFAINDAREYGRYVGHHGLVMEQGLPSEATMTVARPTGVVYDLVEGQQMPAVAEAGKLKLRVELGPCDGRLFMITQRPIGSVRLQVPEAARRGERLTIKLQVLDDTGRPVQAIVPVQLDILDPEGRAAEFSGYYGAADGTLTVAVDIAPNDTCGIWTIRTRELASRKSATAYLRVAQ